MHTNLAKLPKLLFSVLFIVIVIGSYVIVAQTPVTGEWTANARPERGSHKGVEKADDGKIHITFKLGRNKGNHSIGSSFAYEDIQGLSRDQTQNGRVSFRLVREAGTVEGEGTFVDGKGTGTFRFIPDPGYLNTMRSRGFDFERSSSKHDGGFEEKQFSAALLNVTTALADDLRSVGFANLGVDDLFKAAIFKVDSKFMAEMKATGFPDLKMEDLVKARIFNINADFVSRVNQMGFGTNDFENLVKFSIFKVTPEFLSELRSFGFTDLSSEEVVKFRIFNIDPEFIRKAKAEDPNVTVEEMVQMKIGVRKRKTY